MKDCNRTAPPAAPEVADRVRILAAQAYLERTHDAFAQTLHAASALGASGRGVLAGPMVTRYAHAENDGGGTT